MILMIDNYDSFTYNLVQELQEVGEVEIDVVRNDAVGVDELLARGPRAVVISPGPGVPEESGVTMDLIRAAGDLPLLCRGPRRSGGAGAGAGPWQDLHDPPSR
jgi:anthranilate synthase component 2